MTSKPRSKPRDCERPEVPTMSFKMVSGGAWQLAALWLSFAAALMLVGEPTAAKISFEKMTNRDFSGVISYSVQNVSLYECLGWCRDDPSCTSAAFSFVVNPFAALQETTCMLHNETQARQTPHQRQSALNPNELVTVVAQPQKATNLYFFNKIDIPSESVCQRLWAFERFPNRRLRHHDKPFVRAASKDACLAACISSDFVCRSVEFNYLTQQCYLNGYDRRSPIIVASAGLGGSGDLLDTAGTDYFENACLLGEDVCTESRIYDYAKLGVSLQRVAHFVELNYYPDKEMLVKSQAGCIRACTIEHEFICRSILYRSSFKQGQPNCALYHLDHKTFPDGADTFASPHLMQPLLDSGDTSAVYLEAVCNDTLPSSSPSPSSPTSLFVTSTAPSTSMIPTGITLLPSPSTANSLQIVTTGSASSSLVHHLAKNHSSSGSASIVPGGFGAPATTLSPLNSQSTATIRMPATQAAGLPSNIQVDIPGTGSGRPPQHITMGPARPPHGIFPSTATLPNHLIITQSNSNSNANDNIADESLSLPSISGMTGSGHNYDQNCDSHGFCYNVSLRCTDTRMVVNVKTQRPFHGRIYALGRSETCDAHIKNQNQFQLEMLLSGQDCNTQSAVSVVFEAKLCDFRLQGQARRENLALCEKSQSALLLAECRESHLFLAARFKLDGINGNLRSPEQTACFSPRLFGLNCAISACGYDAKLFGV